VIAVSIAVPQLDTTAARQSFTSRRIDARSSADVEIARHMRAQRSFIFQ